MTADLITFLRARLDEDEQAARAAGGDSWTVREQSLDTVAVYDSRREPVVYDEGQPSDEQMRHIARHDPARALAEVDAKRRILAHYDEARAGVRNPVSQENYDTMRTMRWVVREVLQMLALPYADHPDYRPEWSLGV
ncbi:DUF6221 family protein [Kitasatospora sp. NPDC056076]|uniref:DUF6221 family protein n=1 Tax=Kitasatospora sp. NPDC056076 TaxID=3345703 RepID=UPI0035D59534